MTLGRSVANEEQQHSKAAERDPEAGPEDDSVATRDGRQQYEGEDGPGERTHGVHRPVNPEGLAEAAWQCRLGDQGVPGGGS